MAGLPQTSHQSVASEDVQVIRISQRMSKNFIAIVRQGEVDCN